MARFYDLYDKPMDLLGVRTRRRRLLARAQGNTLEVGVGTGRNLSFYPQDITLTGIDLSPGMLGIATAAAKRDRPDTTLEIGDIHHLRFDDNTFDTVTATCVFCSVADPIAGLAELRRVVRPNGQILLLEHVRPRTRILGWLFDQLTPLTRRLLGPDINRRTEQNLTVAGLTIDEVRRWSIWREIVATPLPSDAPAHV
ncbi:MAG: class I SAM-dependent methyltransferase [Acidimicrobiales bacterium]|nr:class I SAM-dependent methyltransferase [Acidimicrobiales bacterium]